MILIPLLILSHNLVWMIARCIAKDLPITGIVPVLRCALKKVSMLILRPGHACKQSFALVELGV